MLEIALTLIHIIFTPILLAYVVMEFINPDPKE